MDPFDAIIRAADDALFDAVTSAADVIAYTARASHPYTDRSYDLTRSTLPMPATHGSEGQVIGGVIAGEDYASYLEARAEFAFLAPAATRCESRLPGIMRASLTARMGRL